MQYLHALKSSFEEHADSVKASAASKYLRNLSDFYGIPSPVRREILRKFLSENKYPAIGQIQEVIEYCWQQPQREWQYAGMEMASKLARKNAVALLELAEYMIIHKSWWDTVDYIAANIAGAALMVKPELTDAYISRWMSSGNLWLQRTCLIFQLKYYRKTDAALLFRLCNTLSDHPDFFIRKAIGWALRQYSKTEPEQVIQFVTSNKLSNLSRKEALKSIAGKSERKT